MSELTPSDLELIGTFLEVLNDVRLSGVGLKWDGDAPHITVCGENLGLYLAGNETDGYTASTSEYR